MLFCTHCGQPVTPGDKFCSRCGSIQQPGADPTQAAGDPFEFLRNLSPRTASMLCYIPMLGWVAAIVMLAAPTFRGNKQVRFHAFQGLYLFVIWLLVEWVVSPILRSIPHPEPMRAVAALLQLGVFGGWIWMIIKTSQDQFFRLPIVGELAERSVAEQR